MNKGYTFVLVVLTLVFALIPSVHAEAKPAEFALSGLIITGPHGEIGEAWIEKSVAVVTISLLVTNIGDLEGNTTVDLLVNGVKEQSKSVSLAGGARTMISFTVTKTTVGSYAVKVGDLTGSFEVKAPALPRRPAEGHPISVFEASDLVISPKEVSEGEEVKVTLKVKLIGEEKGTHTVTLKVDGLTEETAEVTLDGGASTTVTFTLVGKVGEHTVEVDGLKGSFTVITTPQTVSIWSSLAYIAGILIIIAVVVASIYALYRRGRLPT